MIRKSGNTCCNFHNSVHFLATAIDITKTKAGVCCIDVLTRRKRTVIGSVMNGFDNFGLNR